MIDGMMEIDHIISETLERPEIKPGLSRFTVKILFLLVICLLSVFSAPGQDKLITYNAENTLFTQVLSDLAVQYGLKFAYDARAFEDAHVTFDIENQTIVEVVELLALKYPVRFRLVEGTWMVIRRKEAVSPPKPKAATSEVAAVSNMVSGYVTDALTGEPLIYSSVIVSEQRGTITNQLGFFQIETGEPTLHFYISHLGYQRLDTTVWVNNPQPLKIRLQPFIILMEEVNITRKEKNMLEMGKFTGKIAFNPSQSANLPRLSNDDLVNMLSIIPGINFLSGAGGGLSIRGGDPSENLVLLDGIPLLETGHLLGNVSVLNASFVRQAFVSRGGFDASYGDRAAGLIEMTGRNGPLTHPTIDVSANMLNGNVVASIPIAGKFTLTGAWRRSYLDYWQNHVSARLLKESRMSSEEDYSIDVYPNIWYDDLNLKASLFPSDNQVITFGFLEGGDFQMLDYEVGEKQVVYRNEVVEALNRGYSASWSLQLPKWNHSFVAGYNRMEQARKYESGRQIISNPPSQKPKKNPKANPNPNAGNSNRNKYEIDIDSNKVREIRADWRSEMKSGAFTHQAGIGLVDNDYSYQYYAERSQGNNPIDSLRRSLRQTIGHVFLQQYIEPISSLRVRWGVRANYNQTQSQLFLQPRGGIEYIPSDGVKAYYHSGIYRQFLSRIPKIDASGNVDMVWFLPDSASSGILISTHHVLGCKLEWGGFLFNAELYSRHTTGRQWLFAENYRRASINRIQYILKQGEEDTKGMDMFLQFRHGYFTHQAGWSLADSEDRMDGFNNGEFFPSLNHHRHQLHVNEMFNYKGWALSGSWTYRSGQPRLFASGQDGVAFDRMDYFSQFDVGLIKNFRARRFAVTGGASLLNVFNRINIVETGYMNVSTESGNLSLQTNVSSMAFTPVFFLRFQVL